MSDTDDKAMETLAQDLAGHMVSPTAHDHELFFEARRERILAALTQVRDNAERELAAEKENPSVGRCCICKTTIWHKQERMADERGEFHPICGVIHRAEQAESKLQTAVEALKFYADERRHEGPNRQPIKGDTFGPVDFSYCWSVSHDRGGIAQHAIDQIEKGTK